MAEVTQDIDMTNVEFRQVLELITNTSSSVFLTGRAGTGKSTFLRYICEHTLKNYVVLAPTGIAALNAKGVTIHSFFHIPLRPVPPDDVDYSLPNILKHLKLSKEALKVIRELDLVIIDEVSMVRADTIDFIDRVLRAVSGQRRVPFGGKQLLLVGDIFQLEPVVTSEARDILAKFYPAFFFFNARAYKEIELVSVELKKVYRQTDNEFIGLLDRIRLNQAQPSDLALLNARVAPEEARLSANESKEDEFSIMLASRRDIADSFNSMKMDLNPNEPVVFKGEITDEFPAKSLPTDMELLLKVGAQVMLVRNDRDKRWVNGTLARITGIGNNRIEVCLENGTTCFVEREQWENIKYTYNEEEKRVKEEVIGTFVQFPLKAAWALTIHKSQGLTFNNVVIDMGGGAFSAGQTYVALSRCRSLDGLSFISPLRKRDIIVNREAEQFSRNFNDRRAIDRSLREARARACFSASLSAYDEGDYRNAVKYMIDSLTVLPEAPGPQELRLVAMRLARTERLKEEIERQSKMLVKISAEYVELGRISMEYPEGMASAVANLKKAIELNPESFDAMFELSRAYGKMRKYSKADETFNRLLSMQLSRKQRLQMYLWRAELCEDKGDFAAALLNYNAALKLDKKNAALLEKVARLYEKLGFGDVYDDEDDED